jgi:hypothetical protein
MQGLPALGSKKTLVKKLRTFFERLEQLSSTDVIIPPKTNLPKRVNKHILIKAGP